MKTVTYDDGSYTTFTVEELREKTAEAIVKKEEEKKAREIRIFEAQKALVWKAIEKAADSGKSEVGLEYYSLNPRVEEHFKNISGLNVTNDGRVIISWWFPSD